jgi:uncharacterized alkaline shock family protein YloU
MTDVASGPVPAPAQPSTGAVYGTPVSTPTGEADKSTVDSVKEKAVELADQAGDALGKAGEAVGDAAGKAYEASKEAAGKAYEAGKEAAAGVVSRIRNNAILPAERGHTTIANEVVEKIAGIAAREVPGVYDLGGDVARVFSAVKERLGLGEEKAANKGVSVKLEGKNAEIVVTIVLEYGFQVFSVTEKAREKVISSVENLLGLDVTNVDITVDDVHVPEEGPVGNDAERAKGYTAETKAIVVGAE